MDLGFKILFICVLFAVSFLSDVVLNDFTRTPLRKVYSSSILKSLTSYFKNKSIVESGVYAGITVVVVYVMLIILTKGKYPSREVIENIKKGKIGFSDVKTMTWELLTAFILGYSADVIIHKMNIFGNYLNAYYSVAGAGLWGALAFVFAIAVSYGVIATNMALLTS